jgi:hypothetical protein
MSAYRCEKCGFASFKTEQSFQGHLLTKKHLMRQENVRQDLYQCKTCNKWYCGRSGISHHKKTCSSKNLNPIPAEGANTPPAEVQVCNVQKDGESILENRRFVCNVCGKRYSISQSLHAHKCKAVTSTSSIIPGVEEMQKILVNSEKKHIDHQNAILETMQKKFVVQQKQIEAMQKKIDEIGILLLRNANKQEVAIDSQCAAQEPQSNKKRKKINKAVRQQVLNQQENACGAC